MKRGNSTGRAFLHTKFALEEPRKFIEMRRCQLAANKALLERGPMCNAGLPSYERRKQLWGQKIFLQPSFCIRSLSLLAAMHFPPAKWPPQQQHRDVLLLLTAGWEVTKKTRRTNPKNQHGLCVHCPFHSGFEEKTHGQLSCSIPHCREKALIKDSALGDGTCFSA